MTQLDHRPSGQIQTLQAHIQPDGIYIPFNQPSQNPIQQPPTPVYPAQIGSQQPYNNGFSEAFKIACGLGLFFVIAALAMFGLFKLQSPQTVIIQPQQPQPYPVRY